MRKLFFIVMILFSANFATAAPTTGGGDVFGLAELQQKAQQELGRPLPPELIDGDRHSILFISTAIDALMKMKQRPDLFAKSVTGDFAEKILSVRVRTERELLSSLDRALPRKWIQRRENWILISRDDFDRQLTTSLSSPHLESVTVYMYFQDEDLAWRYRNLFVSPVSHLR